MERRTRFPARCLRILLLGAAALAGISAGTAPVSAAASANTWMCSTAATGCSSTTLAALPAAQDYVAVTGSGSNIYALDGYNGSPLQFVYSYSPTANSWTTGAKDPTKRYGTAAATASDGKVYDLGGIVTNSASSVAAYYSPSANAFTSIAAMPTAREHLGAAVGADGLVYAIGGYTGTKYVGTVEAYNPTTNTWTTKASMPTARAYLGVVAASNGLIYAIGGYNGTSFLTTVEAYNPSTNTWTCSTGDTSSGCSSASIAPMPTARTTKIAQANGIIYAIGGYNGSTYLSYVEAYNPTTNTWECSSGDTASGCTATPLVAMPTARAFLGVALGSDGNIYAVGGSNGSYLTTIQAYGPLTVPGTPTAVTATAGDSSATVSWTAPGSTGGSTITSYTVNCSPTCTAVTASSTSATVTGLTNGTSYTFTVTATNFVGSGSTSAASSAVTPTASCSTSTSNLSVSGAAPGTFSTRLNGQIQKVYTSLGSFSAGNTTCSGWQLQFQATQFACSSGTAGCPAGGSQLPAGSLLMAPPTVSSCQSSCGSGSTANPPSICLHGTAALDSGSAVTVASAAQNTGDGTYTFTPGAIGSGNLQLTMPSYAYATTYSSTLTVTIAQGPAATC